MPTQDADINTKAALAVETSGRIGSVALGCGSTVQAELVFSGFMRQGAELLPRIQTLLRDANCAPADIQKVIITVGPGSFTGLRIAVTVAKMLSFAHGTNIVALDSTDVIAANAPTVDPKTGQPIERVCTILDAKRNLFYSSVFDRGPDGWTKILGTEALRAEELFKRMKQLPPKKTYFLGEGLVYYADKFKAPFTAILDEQFWAPRAANLLRLGLKQAARGCYADPLTLAPLYIRQPEAVENLNKHNNT